MVLRLFNRIVIFANIIVVSYAIYLFFHSKNIVESDANIFKVYSIDNHNYFNSSTAKQENNYLSLIDDILPECTVYTDSYDFVIVIYFNSMHRVLEEYVSSLTETNNLFKIIYITPFNFTENLAISSNRCFTEDIGLKLAKVFTFNKHPLTVSVIKNNHIITWENRPILIAEIKNY